MNQPEDRLPTHRYTPAFANEIERKWQDRWEQHRTFYAPNPAGPLHDDPTGAPDDVARRPKRYVLDMFPYPSGAGLHVGHPLGYIGTDVYARYSRMSGYNVLHAMGYDAFGLPAEQYAVQTGQHPAITTAANIANMQRQLRALGLGHDPRRGVSTTDPEYYQFTQWIFLQLFNSYYDTETKKARPIGDLIEAYTNGTRPTTGDTPWNDLTRAEQRDLIDSQRLAYVSEAPVNWCPALGTVLANEEVTSEGRSERGNFPVIRRPLRQWMMRITTFADRLIDDLDLVTWPESVKSMQRNWIGKSFGANVRFAVADHPDTEIEVFTTRPDTLFGATYMVLSPEHPLVDTITTPEQSAAVSAYRTEAAERSDLERQADTKTKTGVATGAYAINPVNQEQLPIYIADYVLMGYGTGAIMAVPAHDQRDFDFAKTFDLPIRMVILPEGGGEDGCDPSIPADQWEHAYSGHGTAINSANNEISLDGLDITAAKAAISTWLGTQGAGEATITYKLRDWLFSRQRYWGEPFPIVWDADNRPLPLAPEHLPVLLPEIDDFSPKTFADDDQSSDPEPPLGRNPEWATVTLELNDPITGDSLGPATYRRELNTMPQWAGSCWYYLRYLDPTNKDRFVDPAVESYWAGADHTPPPAGMVDLYVGGVEHAVLHLLYARFWHKVLYDLGQVTNPEPFHRLFNQGYIQAFAYTDARGVYVEATEVEARDGQYFFHGEPVNREYGKMGKSLKNMVTPDEMYEEYGADTLRLYEMFMGPLETSRPWSTTDVVGVHRFLQRLWRNAIDEHTGALRPEPATGMDDVTERLLHRTIAAVRNDFEQLSFNTAIARLFELNNHCTTLVERDGGVSHEVIRTMALLLAPLAPHVAEELWERLGGTTSLAWEPFPQENPDLLVDATVELPIQINGKVRARITVASDADAAAIETAARNEPAVVAAIGDQQIVKVIVIPGRAVNLVVK